MARTIQRLLALSTRGTGALGVVLALGAAGAAGVAGAHRAPDPRGASSAPVEMVAPVARVEPGAEPAGATPLDRRVLRIEVRGPIDESTQSHVHRALGLAEEGDGWLVLDVDTPGGEVEVTWQIARALQRAADRGVHTVAWVNERATSAGAMLSMACELLYMQPTGTMGSALPVVLGPGGVAPVSQDPAVVEKHLSHFREEFRAIAEASGRSGLLAEAMVDPDVEVVLLELDEGQRLVSGQEYADLRVRGEVPRFLRTVVAQGKLLNVGGPEALELGLADGLVDSLEDLASHLGARPEDVVLVERTRSEDVASVLYTWSPLLLVLAFVLAWLELKIPGFGVPGVLSIVCFGLVLAGRWLVGLADVPHVVLIVLGVAGIAVEIFLVPGTLWAGITGAVLLMTGIVWSFAGIGTGFEYGLDRAILLDEALRVMGAAFTAMLATVLLSRFLPETPLFGRLVLDPSRDGTGSARGRAMPEAAGARATLARIGARGRALTALRPVGKVVLVADDSVDFEARSSGPEVPPGAAVVVVEVQDSGRLVVEAAQEGEA